MCVGQWPRAEALADRSSAIETGYWEFISGDINARVGMDNSAWEQVLDPHGIDKMNENAQHLLEFSCDHTLYCSNSLF